VKAAGMLLVQMDRQPPSMDCRGIWKCASLYGVGFRPLALTTRGEQKAGRIVVLIKSISTARKFENYRFNRIA
jgi:hypothetical protein